MELLKQLINAAGVSGSEAEIRQLIIKKIKPLVDKVKIDSMGNIIAYKKGKGPKVMLAAHMDEVGLMVKTILSDGRILLSEIGGIEPTIYIGQVAFIQLGKKKIYGTVTTKEVSDDHEMTQLPHILDLVFDTGLTKKELRNLGVSAGDPIVIQQNAINLGKKDIICGKALDDRIGCYILLEVAKKLKNTKRNLYYVFTVQEELGLFGAKTSSYQVDPDWAIAIDVVNANDAGSGHYVTKSLGSGPVLTMKDAEMISNKCIDNWIKEIAKKYKMPLQLEVSNLGTTDAARISLDKEGVPSTVLGVAVRNLHTNMGIAHMCDIKGAITILSELLKDPKRNIYVE
tara:strand:+ start:7469 stop:8494 length:1026 start_codon:yes stop_codon:yes gene_type:complete